MLGPDEANPRPWSGRPVEAAYAVGNRLGDDRGCHGGVADWGAARRRAGWSAVHVPLRVPVTTSADRWAASSSSGDIVR